MGNSDSFDTGTGELAPRTGEFLAGVLALSRISRVTVALESGHRAGPALQAAAKLTAHAETSVLFDRWRGDPLADLAAALFSAHPDVAPAPGESLAQGLRRLQSRERRSLLVIFDRFDDYLAQPADDPRNAAFDQAFVQMANDDELDVHFLLVQDEAAESLLGRFQDGIPGIGDGCLRMPAGGIGDSRDETPTAAPAPDAGRASRRDRSFGMLLERLTAIAPGDEAAPGQTREAIPPAPPRPAESGQPPADVEPVQRVQPAGNDTIVNDTLADRAIQDQPASDRTGTAVAMAIAVADVAGSRARTRHHQARAIVPGIPGSRPRAAGSAGAVCRAADAGRPASPDPGAGRSRAAQQGPDGAAGRRAGGSRRFLRLPAPGAGQTGSYGSGKHRQPGQGCRSRKGSGNRRTPAEAGEPCAAVNGGAVDGCNSTGSGAESRAGIRSASRRARTPPLQRPPHPPHPARSRPAAHPPCISTCAASASATGSRQWRASWRDRASRCVDVKVMNKGPSVADVRYFRDEDREAALTVQKALSAAGVPVPRLSRMNGFENSTRPGHFEAWLGSDYTPDPVRRR